MYTVLSQETSTRSGHDRAVVEFGAQDTSTIFRKTNTIPIRQIAFIIKYVG